MIKRTVYITALCVGMLLTVGLSQSRAQVKQERIGYVNPQSILQKMPEWQAVRQKLQNFVQKKKQTLADQKQDLEDQISAYQDKQSQMSEDAQAKEEKRLGNLQANLQTTQRKAQQDIQQKQQALVAPLNESINNSINNVAKKKSLAYVLNTTTTQGDIIILYASDSAKQKYDITSAVMDDLGIGN